MSGIKEIQSDLQWNINIEQFKVHQVHIMSYQKHLRYICNTLCTNRIITDNVRIVTE